MAMNFGCFDGIDTDINSVTLSEAKRVLIEHFLADVKLQNRGLNPTDDSFLDIRDVTDVFVWVKPYDDKGDLFFRFVYHSSDGEHFTYKDSYEAFPGPKGTDEEMYDGTEFNSAKALMTIARWMKFGHVNKHTKNFSRFKWGPPDISPIIPFGERIRFSPV